MASATRAARDFRCARQRMKGKDIVMRKILLEAAEVVCEHDRAAFQAILRGNLIRWWFNLGVMGLAFIAHKAASQVLAVRIAARETLGPDLDDEQDSHDSGQASWSGAGSARSAPPGDPLVN